MKKVLTIVSIIGSGVTSVLAQGIVVGSQAAGTTANGGALLSFLALAQTFINRLVPFAIGVAVLGFFWFLIMFIWKGGQGATEKDASIKGMGYSILALFLMVAVWGIIAMLANLLGVGIGGGVPTPTIPQPAP